VLFAVRKHRRSEPCTPITEAASKVPQGSFKTPVTEAASKVPQGSFKLQSCQKGNQYHCLSLSCIQVRGGSVKH